jgi:tetratricopeptide (TPR) repeat protein
MNSLLKNLITAGKFLDAKDCIPKIPNDDLYSVLIEIGDTENNICAYAFTCFLILEDETVQEHERAYSLLIGAYLYWLDGAYPTPVYHARAAMLTDPEDVSLGGSLLFLNRFPEKPISNAEAKEIAKIILAKHPNNGLAQDVMVEYAKNPDLFNDQPVDNSIKSLVLRGEFIEAQKLAPTLDTELQEMLFRIGDRERSLCAYAYVWSLLFKAETAELHIFAANLLLVSYAYWLEGSYQTAAYHARRAAQLNPDNLSYAGYLLFLNKVPSKPISDDEAYSAAQSILEKEPSNPLALAVVAERLKKYKHWQ